MIFVYIQNVATAKNAVVPFRLTLKNAESLERFSFNFRPEITIPKKTYDLNHLDRMELLAAPPFCDIADELIEVLQNDQLAFSDANQFKILKSQFKNIGYNFNTNPKYLFYNDGKTKLNAIAAYLKNLGVYHEQSSEYATAYVALMDSYFNDANAIQSPSIPANNYATDLEISNYKMAPGVYYFLDALEDVIYVGKAKNIRKRLQSHFSKQSTPSGIDYSKVKSITVEYSGNDILAQLIESANIKALKPVYNTQQVQDPAPYIINKGKTAQGILRLKITRKAIADNMPERYFNRLSVKQSLENFCSEYQLCRKHCGIETVKGPCSNDTVKHQDCVCAGKEHIADYNKRFDIAFYNFQNKKSRKIFKLKGRHGDEDAFIYLVNDIYEGYGFIDKEVSILNVNDILGHLNVQHNNYDTSRIVSALSKSIPLENILIL